MKTFAEHTDLQELSKKTLGSYVKKAHVSGLGAAADQENAYMRAKGTNELQKDGSPLRKKFTKASHKSEKREQGINRAVKKLTKEDTMRPERQIVEILASANPQHQLKEITFGALTQRAGARLNELKRNIAANYFGQNLDEGALQGFKDQDLKAKEKDLKAKEKKVKKHIARGKTEYEKPYGTAKKFKRVSSDQYNPLQYEYND